jgi:hypothetical protein
MLLDGMTVAGSTIVRGTYLCDIHAYFISMYQVHIVANCLDSGRIVPPLSRFFFSLAGQPPTYHSTGCITSPAREERVWRLHCTSHDPLEEFA